jgi:PRC-barrel domain
MATQSGDAVATEETVDLISADKVEGTSVYSREGEKLGSIYGLMIDKFSGRVIYAVMSFGGFLGIGDRYHPLPWSVLTYDPGQGATSSISTGTFWKRRRPMVPARCPTGPIRPGAGACTTTMAPTPIGNSQTACAVTDGFSSAGSHTSSHARPGAGRGVR